MKRFSPALPCAAAAVAFGLLGPAALAQNTGPEPAPVIDVHVHAMEDAPWARPVCPNQSRFLASDPADGPEAPFGWSQEDCTPKLYPAPKGEYLKAVVAEMDRLNVTAVVFGDPGDVKKWQAASPHRVIPGTAFHAEPGAAPQADQLKSLEVSFTRDGFKVMGEIGVQYQGLSPSDEKLEPYFALAERLDIPVAIHMGTGGSGRANIAMPAYRASAGNPLLLEDLLARHPRLRVQVMHAGYPMIDNLLALLQANSHVYVDTAGLIWSYPIKEVNRYFQRIVDAGFGDRIMFGTDQLGWPGLMAYSISLIQNADYLTSAQKRDILYNNAARFLRLDRPHGSALAQPGLGSRGVPLVHADGLDFKDLDRNGQLDPYEDWRLPAAKRAADLVRRMSLERKCATLVHATLAADGNRLGMGSRYDMAADGALVQSGISSFITRLSTAPRSMAEQANALQALAEGVELGIPLTISTDPRNQIGSRIGFSSDASGFSTWPDPLGFAAIGDAALVKHFGDIARTEYRAVGIHMALSPQADLGTEPRWPRMDGTFGEDPALVSRMVAAYVQGFQGSPSGLEPTGVATVVKHWVGYGAAKDGWDGHNRYGRFADFSGGGFGKHLEPFRAAFAAGTAAVMPTYDILEGVRVRGKPLEPVGAGFNRQLLTQLLREDEHFKGLVVSDWAITNDCPAACQGGWQPGTPPVIGMPWGVESLTREDRFAKAVNAGVDQIGGTDDYAQLVAAVRAHKVPERRIDEAVERVLELKFRLGLFEDPYVDEGAAGRVVGDPATQAQADAAQKASLVVLENRQHILPLKPGTKVFLVGFGEGAAKDSGLAVVDSAEEADVVVMRASAPRTLEHPGYFFGSRQPEGPLDYRADDPVLKAILGAAARRPTILAVHLDRPAVLAQVNTEVSALVGEFGIRDDLLLKALADRSGPAGRLPFELPSSMAEVLAQKSSVPHDTAHPLYAFGYGLGW